MRQHEEAGGASGGGVGVKEQKGSPRSDNYVHFIDPSVFPVTMDMKPVIHHNL